MTQEQENFYRHSTVIVDETKESFLLLLDFHLKNQGITFHRFIEIHGHEIYHMCYNRYPCCQCPIGTRPYTIGCRILHPPQLDILFNQAGGKLLGHKPKSVSAPNCCCPVNPNLQLQDLDFTLARLLLINFTTLVPQGSPERNALDLLVNSRNHSFAHAKEGKISNNEYQKSMVDIEKSLLVLAKIYGKETETKQRLGYIIRQPFNTTICLHLQNALLKQCQIDETIRRLLDEKALPESLTKDIEDIRVVEGCDAKLELWTKEEDVKVEWFKGDFRIEESEKFVVETSGLMHSLIVTNTELTDRGIYSAKFRDLDRRAKVDITEYFTKNTKRKNEYIEGDNADLSCAVIEDNVTAYWEKDGVRVQNCEKYKIIDEGTNHKLSIVHVNLQDAGNYSVKISDRIRFTSIQVKEYFSSALESRSCLEGENVHFECEILEDNQTALWFKDGTEVTTSEKYKVERHGKFHRLVINNAQTIDKGKYSVRIKNCVRWSVLTVKAIPTTIRQLSDEDKIQYLEIIKSATETRYYIRIMIIGENGVGKTCLLRRLFGESIDNVQSTDGLDVYRCKIRLHDGQWAIDKETNKRKDLINRIRRAVQADTKTHEAVNIEQREYSQSSVTVFSGDKLSQFGTKKKEERHTVID